MWLRRRVKRLTNQDDSDAPRLPESCRGGSSKASSTSRRRRSCCSHVRIASYPPWKSSSRLSHTSRWKSPDGEKESPRTSSQTCEASALCGIVDHTMHEQRHHEYDPADKMPRSCENLIILEMQQPLQMGPWCNLPEGVLRMWVKWRSCPEATRGYDTLWDSRSVVEAQNTI